MLEPGREPRASTLDIHQPKETHKKGAYYLALTFGTLLSFQGADALVLQPFGLRSRRYLDCTPRSAAVKPRGFVRRLTRLAARSVLARCRENTTPPAAPSAGGSPVGLPSRSIALSPGDRRPPRSAGRPFLRGRRGQRRRARRASRIVGAPSRRAAEGGA